MIRGGLRDWSGGPGVPLLWERLVGASGHSPRGSPPGWLASVPRVSGDVPCVIAGGMGDLSWPPVPGAQGSTEWKVWDLGFAAKGQ